MEYQKITNLLDTTSDKMPRFITNKWVEVYDQSGSTKDRYRPSKQIMTATGLGQFGQMVECSFKN